MSWKYSVVSVWRAMAGAFVDACGHFVEHYDYWNPIGRQCFKLASLAFFPFGKEVQYGGSTLSVIANIFWMIFSGIPLAIAALLNGLLLCCTIIGIPFGMQCFKMAKLALSPFGAVVIHT